MTRTVWEDKNNDLTQSISDRYQELDAELLQWACTSKHGNNYELMRELYCYLGFPFLNYAETEKVSTNEGSFVDTFLSEGMHGVEQRQDDVNQLYDKLRDQFSQHRRRINKENYGSFSSVIESFDSIAEVSKSYVKDTSEVDKALTVQVIANYLRDEPKYKGLRSEISKNLTFASKIYSDNLQLPLAKLSFAVLTYTEPKQFTDLVTTLLGYITENPKQKTLHQALWLVINDIADSDIFEVERNNLVTATTAHFRQELDRKIIAFLKNQKINSSSKVQKDPTEKQSTDNGELDEYFSQFLNFDKEKFLNDFSSYMELVKSQIDALDNEEAPSEDARKKVTLLRDISKTIVEFLFNIDKGSNLFRFFKHEDPFNNQYTLVDNVLFRHLQPLLINTIDQYKQNSFSYRFKKFFGSKDFADLDNRLMSLRGTIAKIPDAMNCRNQLVEFIKKSTDLIVEYGNADKFLKKKFQEARSLVFDSLVKLQKRHGNYQAELDSAISSINVEFNTNLARQLTHYVDQRRGSFKYWLRDRFYSSAVPEDSVEQRTRLATSIKDSLMNLNKDNYHLLISRLHKDIEYIQNPKSKLKTLLIQLQKTLITRYVLGLEENSNFKVDLSREKLQVISKACHYQEQKNLIDESTENAAPEAILVVGKPGKQEVDMNVDAQNTYHIPGETFESKVYRLHNKYYLKLQKNQLLNKKEVNELRLVLQQCEILKNKKLVCFHDHIKQTMRGHLIAAEVLATGRVMAMPGNLGKIALAIQTMVGLIPIESLGKAAYWATDLMTEEDKRKERKRDRRIMSLADIFGEDLNPFCEELATTLTIMLSQQIDLLDMETFTKNSVEEFASCIIERMIDQCSHFKENNKQQDPYVQLIQSATNSTMRHGLMSLFKKSLIGAQDPTQFGSLKVENLLEKCGIYYVDNKNAVHFYTGSGCEPAIYGFRRGLQSEVRNLTEIIFSEEVQNANPALYKQMKAIGNKEESINVAAVKKCGSRNTDQQKIYVTDKLLEAMAQTPAGNNEQKPAGNNEAEEWKKKYQLLESRFSEMEKQFKEIQRPAPVDQILHGQSSHLLLSSTSNQSTQSSCPAQSSCYEVQNPEIVVRVVESELPTNQH